MVPTEEMVEGTQDWNRSSSWLCLALIYCTHGYDGSVEWGEQEGLSST